MGKLSKTEFVLQGSKQMNFLTKKSYSNYINNNHQILIFEMYGTCIFNGYALVNDEKYRDDISLD